MTRDRRPRLLFLCHTLPYPPDGGGWIRSYHLLEGLCQAFSVRALCFERTGAPDHDVDAAVAALGKLCPIEAFPVPQEERLTRRVRDHLSSLLGHRVFTVYKHRSRPFRERLVELLDRENFDLVHVDSLDLSTYLPFFDDIPVACGHHNVESRLLWRRAEAEDSQIVRTYLRYQARLQEQEERRWCDRVELNVTVSQEDRRFLENLAPEARVRVVPNGVDTDYFTPGGRSREEIVFVGPASWFPNRDGMDYFFQEILPRLKQRTGDVSVTWVGSAHEETRKRLEAEYGTRMPGYVEDIRPHVRRAACFIVPLRVGGGSRLKILDAWAMGKAVVSTRRGCEGLRAEDGKNILIRDDPAEFAEAVHRVLSDADLRESLGREGRRTAEKYYSWTSIQDDLNTLYRKLLADGFSNPDDASP